MARRSLSAGDVSTEARLHGVPPELALAIWEQESSSGRNLKDSPKGAVGGFQMMPPTFRQYSPQGNIRDPVDNMMAGLAYLKHCLQKSGGDPEGAAQCYYSGQVLPPGVEGPNSGPGTPTTRQYGQQILARMGPVVEDEAEAELPQGMPDFYGATGEESLDEPMPSLEEELPDIGGLTRSLDLSMDDSWLGGSENYELDQYVKKLVDEELGRAR